MEGIYWAQVGKIPGEACGGFRDAQFARISAGAFGGFTEACVLASPAVVWSQVTAQKLANMTEDAFHGFKNTTWMYITGDAVSALQPIQGMYLRHHTCGGFTADQISKMQPTFLGSLAAECLRLAPSPCWLGVTADGIKAIQGKLGNLNLPDVVPEIPASSWSKLTENFAKVCPYVTGTQISSFQTSVFESIPNSCCNSIAADAWHQITAAQILAVRLDAFAQELTYTRIIGLNNKTMAAISPQQWNALGAKHNSNITELLLPEIFRIVAVAKSRFLNFEKHQAVFYPVEFIKSVKSAVDTSHSSFRDQVLSTVWPEPDNLSLLQQWSWLHSVFLAQGPKSGIVPAHIEYFETQQNPNASFVPLSGIRRKFVPLITNEALAVLSPALVSTILPDTFAAFTAAQLDVMGNISYVSIENWRGVSPVVIEELSFDTFRKLNSSTIEALDCSQVSRLDIDQIYEDYNKNAQDPLILSFKAVLSKCTIWREPVYGLSVRSIVLIACGCGCVVLAAIGGIIYWRYRKRQASRAYRAEADSAPLLDSVRHY